MEKFEKFEIKQQQFVFGGEITQTCWENHTTGEGGCDEYNTETRKINYDVECIA